MTTGTDMPAALPAPDARFLSELARQLRGQHPVQQPQASPRCASWPSARELVKD